MESSKEKLIRIESNLYLHRNVKLNPNFKVGKPDNLNKQLELFSKDIDDYDGMWTESDFDFRIENGDKFMYITDGERIVSWVWFGNKIFKSWDKNGCPVYNTPSYSESEIVMQFDDKTMYGYNIWIDKDYRGIKNYSIGIQGFKYLYGQGYTHVIFDIEMWNKTALIHALKENGLKGNIVNLLDN
tara:strand:+ start:146 stop:700 length:555 start_codon:yes stop_codon:yes gene_type:complete